MASIFETVLQAQNALQQQRSQSLLDQARNQALLQQAAQFPLQQQAFQQQVASFPLQERLRQIEANLGQQQVERGQRQLNQEETILAGNLAEQALSIEDPSIMETFVMGAAQKLGLQVDPTQVGIDQLQQLVDARNILTRDVVSERERFEEQKSQARANFDLTAYRTQLDKIKSETGALKDKFSQASKIRSEVQKATGDFSKIEDAFAKVKATQEGEVTGASDIALIFNFMKMLDPGSVVREGEFATAENAGGAFERFGNMYNKLLTGERLTPKQRNMLVSESEKIFDSASKINQKRTEDFVSLGNRFGLEREDIIVGTDESSPTRIRIDVDGNIIQ